MVSLGSERIAIRTYNSHKYGKQMWRSLTNLFTVKYLDQLLIGRYCVIHGCDVRLLTKVGGLQWDEGYALKVDGVMGICFEVR